MQRKTLTHLAVKYKKSIPWIMKQRDNYQVEAKIHFPRAINLICDATFMEREEIK
ncbi:MAG: hypothetical protein LGB78_06435 [Sulfurovum sp.]|nr:hypothetical protein [Sulfurovum sp.]MCB4781689.1 hypothetical protein [Sulfurovum sp.]